MISKDGNLYYSEEELTRALENNNALEYALSHGYDLIRKGNSYTMKEHDSMVFKPDGKWFWNSQGFSGHALDFIQRYEGRSLVEAVLSLAGADSIITTTVRDKVAQASVQPRLPLKLPEPSKDNNAVINYLVKQRCIDNDVVFKLINEGKIYQSKAYNNLVMIGHDENEQPKYVAVRSTGETKFRIDVKGSDKSYPFIINGSSDTKTVCILESPIEVMSYYSLCRMMGSDNFNADMIASGGATAKVAIARYLKNNPHIENIVVGLNNDETHKINAGKNGTTQLFQLYSDKYNMSVHAPHLNDWNDVLVSLSQNKVKSIIHIPDARVNPIHEKQVKQTKLNNLAL